MTFNFLEVTRQDSNLNEYLTAANSFKVNRSLSAKSGILAHLLILWTTKWTLRKNSEDNRVATCQELLDRANDDESFMETIITGDETWVYGYDVETKAQSSQWTGKGSPRPKKARQVKSNVKVMLTVFFDVEGVVHHEFLPQGETVNRFYYLEVLRRLRENMRRNRPELWRRKSWVMHHDNAPAHSSLLIRDYCAKSETTVLPQPPYSPDLAPADFFLFQN